MEIRENQKKEPDPPKSRPIYLVSVYLVLEIRILDDGVLHREIKRNECFKMTNRYVLFIHEGLYRLICVFQELPLGDLIFCI